MCTPRWTALGLAPILLLLLLSPLALAEQDSDQAAARELADELAEELANRSLPPAERAALEEYLRFLKGLAVAQPMPAPMPDFNLEPTSPTDPGQLVSFDPETGAVTLREAAAGDDAPRASPPYYGTSLPGAYSDGGDGIDGGGGADGETRVCTPSSRLCSTHSVPWRTVVKLMMRFRVGTTDYYYVGSAASVSSFHLMTAGHIVYNHDPDGNGNTSDARWADEVWAWPGQTDLVNPLGPAVSGGATEEDWPWGVAKSVRLVSYTGWTQSRDYNHDMGYVTLDRRLGDRVGWMGAETGVEASALNFDGYPTETPYVPSGEICPYYGYDSGNVNSYTTYRIHMCAYVYGGHSGGPVWRLTGTDRYIQGVWSTSNRTGSAYATRLTSAKFDDLYNTIIPEDESVRPPTARPNLIEYVLDLNAKDVLDNSVPQGQAFQIEYNVFNVGFAASGTITVDFYLSTNTWITTGDYLLGTVTLGSLAANSYYNPTTTRTIPCSVPTGTYYVGYIFSCTTTEYSDNFPAGFWPTNNTVVIADETVAVTSGLPGSVALVSPANGATCQATSLLLDWNAATLATGYDLQVGTSCGTGTIYSTAATSYTVSGLLNNTTYYWRVRGSNSCGDGAWTSCRSFTTTPATPGVAALVSPANGATCQATSLTLDWSDVTNAVQYEVQIGTSCGTGTVYAQAASSQAVTGLALNTTYYWRVRAQNACGTFGSWSACRSFTTTPAVPAVAVLASPANGATCQPTSLTLDWNDVTGAAGYEVQIGTTCGTGTVYAPAASSQLVTGLTNNTTYFWRVRAANACGAFGNWSDCRSFTTIPVPPPVAALLSPDEGACTASTVTLDWSDVTGAVSYEVQIGPSCGSGTIFSVSSSQYEASGLTGGTHFWRVRALDACSQVGNWTVCSSFNVDVTPPTNPTLASPSHATSTWSNDNTVDATWSGASDNCGVLDYSYLWDTSPGTLPDETPEGAGNATTSPPLADGQSHYFHLRTRDVNNNWSGAVHLGPFWIDTTPPANPASVSSPSHAPNTWSNDNTVATQWPAAVDPPAPRAGGKTDRFGEERAAAGEKYAVKGGGAPPAQLLLGSGIQGYSFVWDTSPATLPDGVVETAALQTTSPPLEDGQQHYFHLRAVDFAGNAAVQALHFGPFWIDATPPADPTNFVSNPPVGQWVNLNTIQVQWSGHGDNLSGVAGFSILFDRNPGTLPDQVIDPTPGNQASAGPPLADGSHWFHLRTRDVAGNWTATRHVGPFQIDATPPTTTLLVPNGGEHWQCGEVHTISWNAADATSGLRSIELRYSTDGGTTFPFLIANPAVNLLTYDWTVPPDTSSTAMVQVIALDLANNAQDDESDAVFQVSCSTTGLPEVAAAPVTGFEFAPNVPNPFNPSTVIRFALPYDTRVDLAIFDLDGRRIRTLVQGEKSGPNRYEATWDGRDDRGRLMASGVYFYRLETPEFTRTRRLTLLK